MWIKSSKKLRHRQASWKPHHKARVLEHFKSHAIVTMENLNLSQRNIFFLYVIEWERSFPTDTLHQKGGHIGSISSHLKFIAKIDREIKKKWKKKNIYAARACVCSIRNHKRFKSKSIQVDFKSTEMAMYLCCRSKMQNVWIVYTINNQHFNVVQAHQKPESREECYNKQ